MLLSKDSLLVPLQARKVKMLKYKWELCHQRSHEPEIKKIIVCMNNKINKLFWFIQNLLLL
jgi:hypothetical protein